MKKIGLTGIYFEGALNALLNNVPEGFEAVFVKDSSEYPKLSDVDYVINRLAVDSEIFNHAPKLKFLQKWGAGYDDADIELAGKLGIPIATCPGVNARPVAELAVMHMLSVYRNLIAINSGLKRGIWPKSEYFGRSYMIYDKLVGIIGLGNIGKKVAEMVTGLGAKVQYYDILRQNDMEEKYGYKFASFDELIKTSDIITIHVPQKDDTIDMIGKEQFEIMKKTAIIINTARGPIVNEEALIDALKSGRILGAGIDNFNKEPVSATHPLLQLPNVSATAHAGGNTADNDINMVNYCYSNIVKFDKGLPLNSDIDIVNKQFLVNKQ